MNELWNSLGLRRFLAIDAGKEFLVVDGHVQDAAMMRDDYPRVGYTDPDGETIELRALARALLPTLSDHSVDGLCTHFSLPAVPGERIAGLLAALLNEAISLSPDLLSLLGRLLPGPTGELLRHLAPHAHAAPPPAASPPPPPATAITVDEAFRGNGAIGRALAAFEDRPGQLEMAQLVARTFAAGGTLIVEAGPGTGKTFAYLVPTLIYLRDHPKARVVISTRTKQLQEQLYFKDVPFLTSRIAPQVKVALLKGRENYVCLRQWQTLFPELSGGLDRDLLPVLASLAGWLFRTTTGDIEENRAFLSDSRGRQLWPRLADNPHRCLGKFCPFYNDCFSVNARRHAREANIIVVNHSLLFGDLAADRSIIGDYDYLIVDEAHALEGAARNAFTASLSPSTLDGLLRDVYHRRGRGDGGWVLRLPFPPDDPKIARIRELVGEVRAANGRLFSRLESALPDELRASMPFATEFGAEGERIAQLIRQLTMAIGAVDEALEPDAVRQEGEHLCAEAEEIIDLYHTLFSPPSADDVHWYERREGELRLHSSPLAVDKLISTALYPHLRGLVLTSATLSVGGGFDYVERTLGLDAAPGEKRRAIVKNPFSYHDKMRVYLPTFLPSVNGEPTAYAAALAALIDAISARIRRKALILFTSYRLLNAVHTRLTGKVTAQGIDGPRGKIIEQFKKSNGGAILLGTDSFWEGIDLPGKDLEILVITRLPFSVPTDPINASLSAHLTRAGRDPFRELAIPQAILKFRQGVGRLIRTRADRGAVIITDRRVVEKGYGKMFLASLPVGAQAVSSQDDLMARLSAWFNDTQHGMG